MAREGIRLPMQTEHNGNMHRTIRNAAARGCYSALFCALRPPPDLAHEVWEQFDWLAPGDDRVEPGRLHVTLAPVGAWRDMPEAVIARARSVCASTSAAAFRLVLDDLVVADRILLTATEPIPAFDRFQRQLMDGLADAGLIGRRKPPFRPHMTASYRTRSRGGACVIPVSWPAREFVLIESLVGRRTQIERGRWRLRGAS